MTTGPQVPPEQRPPPPVAPPAHPPVPEPLPDPATGSKKEPVRVETATTPVPHVPFTRAAGAWWALSFGSLVLIVLLVFIGQNLHSTTIHFLGWHWETRVGIAVLVAAICGSLLTFLTGTARMVQLRRAAKKNLGSR
jgi:uncharacterized integral membrane protein